MIPAPPKREKGSGGDARPELPRSTEEAPVHGREHRSTEGDHRSTKKLRETTDPQEPSVHQSRVAAAHKVRDLEIPKGILGVSTRR